MLCLFLAEFDDEIGPHLAFQEPPNIISDDFFSTISGFLMASPKLYGKVISVCLQQREKQILGFPLVIKNQFYGRNEVKFTVGMVLNSRVDAKPYELVVQHVALCLRALEIDCGYLYLKEHKPAVHNFIRQVFNDIRNTGQCALNLTPEHFFSVRVLAQHKRSTRAIYDHDVPVALCPMQLGSSLADTLDFGLKTVAPLINGVNTVQKIADETKMEPRMLHECIRTLISYGFVDIVDIFLFTNEYCLTERFPMLYSDEKLQKNLIAFIRADESQASPPLQTCVRILSKFELGTTMGEIATLYYRENVDVRRLAQFGVLTKMIRRVHKYPMRCVEVPKSEEVMAKILELCDGTRSIDELSVFLRRPDLLRLLQKEDRCVLLAK